CILHLHALPAFVSFLFNATPAAVISPLPYTTLFRSPIRCCCAQGFRAPACGACCNTSTCTCWTPVRPRRTRSLSVLICAAASGRSEEHTSELQSLTNLVCRLLLEKKHQSQPAPSDAH